MTWLDQWHSGRQRFNGVESKGLAIQSRCREHAERAQECLLLRATEVGMKFNIRAETKPSQPLPNLVHERFVGWTQAAANAQFESIHPVALANEHVAFGQQVQSFFTTHAREIAKHGWVRRRGC